MRFYRNGKLKDVEIELSLRRAADMYANGELIEVRDLLADVVNAIDEFTDNEESRNESPV